MVPFIDMTNLVTVILSLIIYVLVLYLGREVKKSWMLGVLLVAFCFMLIGHTTELLTVKDLTDVLKAQLSQCMIVDFVFIFLTFVGFLWLDEIDAKANNKKVVDNLKVLTKKV